MGVAYIDHGKIIYIVTYGMKQMSLLARSHLLSALYRRSVRARRLIKLVAVGWKSAAKDRPIFLFSSSSCHCCDVSFLVPILYCSPWLSTWLVLHFTAVHPPAAPGQASAQHCPNSYPAAFKARVWYHTLTTSYITINRRKLTGRAS